MTSQHSHNSLSVKKETNAPCLCWNTVISLESYQRPKIIWIPAENHMLFCTLYSILRLIPRYEINHQETEWSKAGTELKGRCSFQVLHFLLLLGIVCDWCELFHVLMISCSGFGFQQIIAQAQNGFSHVCQKWPAQGLHCMYVCITTESLL